MIKARDRSPQVSYCQWKKVIPQLRRALRAAKVLDRKARRTYKLIQYEYWYGRGCRSLNLFEKIEKILEKEQREGTYTQGSLL